jgi:HSP20 family protein
MALRKWDPLGDLLDLQERLNQLLEDRLSPDRLEPTLPASGGWTPLADAYETADAFVVHLELPGIAQEDVEVLVEDNRLIVRGDRECLRGERPDHFYRMERSHGPFHRILHLPEGVDPQRVRAHYEDGLLRIDIPKLRARSGRGRGERGE